MRRNGESFYEFALRLSREHRSHFLELTPDRDRARMFEEEREQSIQRQLEMERSDRFSFPEFLERYFAERL
jgi:glutamate--cysteine ligase